MLNQATGAPPRPPGTNDISGYCPMLAQASYPYSGSTYAAASQLPQTAPTNNLHRHTAPQHHHHQTRPHSLHLPQLRPQDQNILTPSIQQILAQRTGLANLAGLAIDGGTALIAAALLQNHFTQGQQQAAAQQHQQQTTAPHPPQPQLAPVATQLLQQPISYHQQAPPPPPPPSHIQQQTLQTIQQNQLQLAPAPQQLVPSLHLQAPPPPQPQQLQPTQQHQRHVPTSLPQTQQPQPQQPQPQALTQTQQAQQFPFPFDRIPALDHNVLATLISSLMTGSAFNGGRTEAHVNHHHHPSHAYHNMHGTHHHHHHHHHAPNSQNNGQDETVLSMSESKPRGLTRTEIDSLTHYIHQNEKDTSTCVICLSKFEPKSKIRPLSCHHTFHAKCVDKWLRANRTCPICRRDALKCHPGKLKKI